MIQESRKLNPPKFEEDLRTFEKKPLWMTQMEGNRSSAPSGTLGLALLTIVVLAAIIAVGFLICK